MNARILLSALAIAAVLPAFADDPAPVDIDPAAEELLEEAEPNPLYDLFYKVDDLLSAEKKDEATAMILGAMGDAQYAKYKADLATVAVRFLLFTEQVDKAKEFFLETIRTEPEVARPGFEIIYANYLNNGDSENAIAWAKNLLEQPLPDDMRQTATGWLLIGLLSAGQEDELFAELARLDKMDPAMACGVADNLCRYTYHNDKFDVLLREIEAFGKAPYGKEESLLQTTIAYGLLAKAGKGDWEGVKAGFPGALDALKERNLQTMLTYLFGRARQQKATETADFLADAVLHAAACKEYTGVRNIASREWVAAGVATDKACLPDRIAALRDLGIPAQSVLSNISRHFYDVLGDKGVLKRLITEMDAVRPLLDDDARRNTLDSLILDASFIVEDYERALAVINAGVADHDEAWHNMTRTKVQAHLALQKGDVDEAVKQFRAFMALIGETTDPTPDPTSGVVYTPEMIQGVNAARIADIYKKAGRDKEAAEAVKEAKGLFEKALVRAKGTETEKGLGDETVKAVEASLRALQ